MRTHSKVSPRYSCKKTRRHASRLANIEGLGHWRRGSPAVASAGAGRRRRLKLGRATSCEEPTWGEGVNSHAPRQTVQRAFRPMRGPGRRPRIPIDPRTPEPTQTAPSPLRVVLIEETPCTSRRAAPALVPPRSRSIALGAHRARPLGIVRGHAVVLCPEFMQQGVASCHYWHVVVCPGCDPSSSGGAGPVFVRRGGSARASSRWRCARC